MKRVHFGDQINPKSKTASRVKLVSMELIQHGWEVLELISQMEYLTSEDVAKIFFWLEENSKGQPRQYPTARNAANEMCLRRLKNHGLLEVARVPVVVETSKRQMPRTIFREKNLLSQRGTEWLRKQFPDRQFADWNPNLRSDVFMESRHDRQLHDMMVNLLCGFRLAGGVQKRVMKTSALEDAIDSGQTYLRDIYPDALIEVDFNGIPKSYLLECDMGTESGEGSKRNSFHLKIPRYRDYMRDRFPIDPFFKGKTQPQILVGCKTLQRAENLKEATFRAGGRRSYAFTAFSYIEPPTYTSCDQVWMIPTIEDYARLSFTASS